MPAEPCLVMTLAFHEETLNGDQIYCLQQLLRKVIAHGRMNTVLSTAGRTS